MDLEDIARSIDWFSGWKHVEKIKFFAWFLHTHRGQERFKPAQIKACFDELGLSAPESVSPFLSSLVKQRLVLKSAKGYRLERKPKEEFDRVYGRRATAVAVDQMLVKLSSRIEEEAEKAYLDEVLICFRNGAFRAAIVMCWNLAYHHLCQYVLANHLAHFNSALAKVQKPRIPRVSKLDDFAEFKEGQVLEYCRASKITGPSLHKILVQKL